MWYFLMGDWVYIRAGCLHVLKISPGLRNSWCILRDSHIISSYNLVVGVALRKIRSFILSGLPLFLVSTRPVSLWVTSLCLACRYVCTAVPICTYMNQRHDLKLFEHVQGGRERRNAAYLFSSADLRSAMLRGNQRKEDSLSRYVQIHKHTATYE